MGNKFKIQKSASGGENALETYMRLITGPGGVSCLIKHELIMLTASWVPGAGGLALRKILYPFILGSAGKGTVFGKNITLRHPKKIRIGSNVIIDDGCLLDAKGEGNGGIYISDGAYIGRNTIIYCKGGCIRLGKRVNIGHNSTIFSSNRVDIGEETIIAAYTYIMSGGNYDYRGKEKIIDQPGFSKGPTTIGKGCWLGAKTVVADGVTIGRGAVIGAGSVVLKDIPGSYVAFGVPARPVKKASE